MSIILEPLEDVTGLIARERNGQMLGPLGPDNVVAPPKFDAEHVAIEEQRGA